ncbi:MAG TPA: hypothetical protein VGC85_05485, partial [Chthoniobacterales bacterium]
CVGNALEVAECVEILQGRGPTDLIDLIVDLARKVSTAPREELVTRLNDGSAWRKFVALVEAQDGDASALERMLDVHRAPMQQPIVAAASGTITAVDAETIGRASVLLGAGRQKANDAVDFAVGFSELKKVGEKVARGEPLMVVHARDEAAVRAITPLLEKAVAIE